jgi:hypothetical protein
MFMEHLGMGMEWSIAIRLQVGDVKGGERARLLELYGFKSISRSVGLCSSF